MLLDLDLNDLAVISNGMIDYKHYIVNYANDPILTKQVERIIDHLQKVLDQELA